MEKKLSVQNNLMPGYNVRLHLCNFHIGGSYSHGSNLNNDRPVAQPGIDGTVGKFRAIET